MNALKIKAINNNRNLEFSCITNCFVVKQFSGHTGLKNL